MSETPHTGEYPVVWVVIDEGCQECGVRSEPVGIYATEAEAIAAQEARQAATDGWRDGGQTTCRVHEMRAPVAIPRPIPTKPTSDACSWCGTYFDDPDELAVEHDGGSFCLDCWTTFNGPIETEATSG